MGDAVALTGVVDWMLRQGVAAFFAVLVYALIQGYLVTGRQYKDMMAEVDERYAEMLTEKDKQIAALIASRDRWEGIALKALNVAEATAAKASGQ